MNIIYDRASIIKELQILLGKVSNIVKYLTPSGVYDDDTRLSVLDFQKQYSLKETGTVNKETLDLLYSEYIRIEREKEYEDIRFFPIRYGETSEQMRGINNNLIKLLNHYGYMHSIKYNSNYYSKETVNGVKFLRKVYLLQNEEYIDEELLGMIIADVKYLNRDKKLHAIE